jgi:outer membrane protein assembly factor BamB
MSVDVKHIPLDALADAPSPLVRRPSRLWISVVPVVAYWGLIILTDQLEFPTFVRFASRLLAGAALALFALIWWWANRRTSMRDKAIGFAIVAAGGFTAIPLAHPSAGLAGLGILMGPLPLVITAWMLWVLVARQASPAVRWTGLGVVCSAAWALLALVRVNGLSGDLRPEYHWRWNPSSEDVFLAERREQLSTKVSQSSNPDDHTVTRKPCDWPGYRGPNRDGTVSNVSIRTDWKKHAPELIWRRRVGPGWSSMVVVDGRLFTQEQREGRESVVCYDAATGAERWSHGDDVRFFEETAGPGPRATPCFSGGRVYSVGCTGVFNCLDAATGKKLWWRDLCAEAGAAIPHWGFTSSPLAVGDLVVVFAGGPSAKNLLAYRARSGELAWSAATGETSYASPQPATLGGKPQILMLTNHGLTSVDTESGALLWEHALPLPPSAPRSTQPQALGGKTVLFASEGDLGSALLDVRRNGTAWSVSQRWATKALKPAFNDSVVSGGFVFGFDGRIFGCIDLETGNRLWKDGRYGEGQVLFLADQSLLLVVSETGEVILLRANPERKEELGRFQALQGRTWNHPTLVGSRLYVRNADEMACYDVGPSGGR